MIYHFREENIISKLVPYFQKSQNTCENMAKLRKLRLTKLHVVQKKIWARLDVNNCTTFFLQHWIALARSCLVQQNFLNLKLVKPDNTGYCTHGQVESNKQKLVLRCNLGLIYFANLKLTMIQHFLYEYFDADSRSPHGN